jgi:hypothetical protein
MLRLETRASHQRRRDDVQTVDCAREDVSVSGGLESDELFGLNETRELGCLP